MLSCDHVYQVMNMVARENIVRPDVVCSLLSYLEYYSRLDWLCWITTTYSFWAQQWVNTVQSSRPVLLEKERLPHSMIPSWTHVKTSLSVPSLSQIIYWMLFNSLHVHQFFKWHCYNEDESKELLFLLPSCIVYQDSSHCIISAYIWYHIYLYYICLWSFHSLRRYFHIILGL